MPTLVSCLMPTADRRPFVPQAIRCFLSQDWPEVELVIVDDGGDCIRDLLPDDPRIRYFRHQPKQLVGAKRNFACRLARGEILAHWDDDDWSAPWRLRYQVEQLLGAQADICGLDRVWFYAPSEAKAWEYVYPSGQRRWVYGASLCYTKAFWHTHPFPEIGVGEDTRFVWADAQARIHVLEDPRFLIALVHRSNTSPKRTRDARYRPKPVSEMEMLLGESAKYYRDLAKSGTAAPARLLAEASAPSTPPKPPGKPTGKGAVLITASRGIGDILRVTPLIRVAHRLGYEVDLLLETDYPEVVTLLAGAPEVRRLYHQPSPRRPNGSCDLHGVATEPYDIATFTFWSAPWRSRVRAARIHVFDRTSWLTEGDSRSIERIARDLGWQDTLPPPFAMTSNRRFGLPPGTIALHPGCKHEWPWKKWHGFDALARRFARVVVVGSEEDRRTDNTYFQRAFEWPAHVRDFTGKLSLADTAALLRECAALIANDSGLMHLGVALGVPTFGLFGLTNPHREAIPADNFHPIAKGLPCEPTCRKAPWGRRDCERHLECFKTLTPDEVFMKVNEIVGAPAAGAMPDSATPPASACRPNETLNLVYHGWVFDASGYGQAARGYIHALHRAGVNLAVVDLAGHPRQVADPLVESLVGRKIDPDFHLFHGIPPFWARQAFPLCNVIAMTVWETDTMPSQWRPVLNHALEVWLPCEFNTSVFGRNLERPVFKLPHVLIPSRATPEAPGSEHTRAWGIQDGELVFYSIFEWQDRKGPREMIEAFLRAFPSDKRVVLLLKANPGARPLAAATLAEARRRVPSTARVELRCEAWSEAQIAALQSRGDCYVSLHRGEGWNLPLFEAACLGKAVVATSFSGPLEYLDPAVHGLVRHQLGAVRQRYAYYAATMRWAEPDVIHAAELMRQVAHDLTAIRQRAAVHAEQLRRRFGLAAIGTAARARLLHLLRTTNPAKWESLCEADRQSRLKPAIPIPGEWYDADYFEHGLKSNWHDGYQWSSFSGLFRETATLLTDVFPEARTFLDAGCAKGFLVRALRERGKECWGFDHSRWALDQAEELARPYVWQASAETVEFSKPCDVLLAFSLFEGLTQAQAQAFLERARSGTRQALFAVITTCDSETQRRDLARHDRDLAHLTLRSREWWHALFLGAGWRQDPLHQAAERMCRQHPLPRKMNWSVYLYAAQP